MALTNTHSGRYTVVVEEDIDPADIEQVLWAMVTRKRPRAQGKISGILSLAKSSGKERSTMKRHTFVRSWFVHALLFVLMVVAYGVRAQEFPTKAVRIVVPFVQGGLHDQLARDLGKLWNQSVLVDNRPGAGGIPAAQNVFQSPADGYSIFQTGNMAFLIDRFVRTVKLPYDLERDFAPVIVLASTYDLLAASPNLPVKNLQELIALARSKPGALNFGSFGVGSSSHINGEGLAVAAGYKGTHVPYKGGGPLLQALMTNEISFAIVPLSASLPLVRAGKLKAVAYGGPQRTPLLPDVPTISESGVKGYTVGSWFAWLVPAATPKAVVARIANDTGRVIVTPAFRDKYLTPFGLEPVNAHGSKMWEMLEADKKAFVPRVKPLNLKID